MELTQWLTPNNLMGFLLIVIRFIGMMVSSPLFSQRTIPIMVTAWMAVIMSFLIAPVQLKGFHNLAVHDLWGFTWLGGQEFVVGALLGFLAVLVFSSIEMAGTLISQQMGLSMVSSLNPFFNAQSQGMGQFYFILAAMMFLTLNIHHSLILGVNQSFHWVPVGRGFTHIPELVGRLQAIGSDIFSFALLFGLPVLATLLVIEVALAYTSKMMPQMNVFMVSLPMKVLIGFTLIALTLSFSVESIGHAFERLNHSLMAIYKFR